MSEYERPERMTREPTVDDVRQLMGASTPHFALQIRNRIRNLIWGLPPDHPARVVGEREVERLAGGGRRAGPRSASARGGGSSSRTRGARGSRRRGAARRAPDAASASERSA